MSQFARDNPSLMPVVLVLLLIALPFHSQKCPSLDDKLYSHHDGYERHPEKKCVGYVPSHNSDHMHTIALSLGFLLSSCTRELWKSANCAVWQKRPLNAPGLHDQATSVTPRARPHTSEGGPQLQACVTDLRPTLNPKGMFTSFPVLYALLFSI